MISCSFGHEINREFRLILTAALKIHYEPLKLKK